MNVKKLIEIFEYRRDTDFSSKFAYYDISENKYAYGKSSWGAMVECCGRDRAVFVCEMTRQRDYKFYPVPSVDVSELYHRETIEPMGFCIKF